VSAATVCAAFASAGETTGTIASDQLVEISGLVASRANDGILWAHNDSGDTARVFAITTSGELRGTYTLAGAGAVDWEDIAIGPGPNAGRDELYLADIGDNRAQRDEIDIYRIAEPTVSADGPAAVAEVTDVDKLILHYPDRPHDAETLLVDPVAGDMFIVTKELLGGPSSVFRVPNDVAPGAPATMLPAGQLSFDTFASDKEIPADAPPLVRALGHLPTAGDISRDGRLIAIRTYATVWVWDRATGETIADALQRAPCEGPSAIEPQGESIAFQPDSHGYTTTTEGPHPPLHRFSW
jgi:hypothetical protein